MNSQTSVEKLRDQKYYHFAHQGSKDLSHPAMRILKKEVDRSTVIIDLGCGEGTRLASLSKGFKKNLFGVDNSKIAIDRAKKQYKDFNFLQGNLTKLPFEDDKFDLAFSAYVFEHLVEPEKVISEATRVLKKDGKLVIIAPNFGSPNRRSPNSDEKKIVKLITGLLKDVKLIFSTQSMKDLEWKKVNPKYESYVIDADTTVEPYLNSLIKFCKKMNLKIEYFSSNWEVDSFSLFQLPFKLLGTMDIYPFYLWGPHLCLVVKK